MERVLRFVDAPTRALSKKRHKKRRGSKNSLFYSE